MKNFLYSLAVFASAGMANTVPDTCREIDVSPPELAAKLLAGKSPEGPINYTKKTVGYLFGVTPELPNAHGNVLNFLKSTNTERPIIFHPVVGRSSMDNYLFRMAGNEGPARDPWYGNAALRNLDSFRDTDVNFVLENLKILGPSKAISKLTISNRVGFTQEYKPRDFLMLCDFNGTL